MFPNMKSNLQKYTINLKNYKKISTELLKFGTYFEISRRKPCVFVDYFGLLFAGGCPIPYSRRPVKQACLL